MSLPGEKKNDWLADFLTSSQQYWTCVTLQESLTPWNSPACSACLCCKQSRVTSDGFHRWRNQTAALDTFITVFLGTHLFLLHRFKISLQHPEAGADWRKSPGSELETARQQQQQNDGWTAEKGINCVDTQSRKILFNTKLGYSGKKNQNGLTEVGCIYSNMEKLPSSSLGVYCLHTHTHTSSKKGEKGLNLKGEFSPKSSTFGKPNISLHFEARPRCICKAATCFQK